MSIINQCLNLGFNPPDLSIKGRFVRFDKGGKKNNGYYRWLSDNVLLIGDWSLGEKHIISAKQSRPLTKQEVIEQRDKRRQEIFDRQAQAEKAAELATVHYKKAVKSNEHWYLKAKQVQGFVSRVDSRGNLIIPMFEDFSGKIVNLQSVLADKRKLFLKGGRVKGCFSGIKGRALNSTDVVFLCEGFATGASVSMATGRTTFISMSASNLGLVAKKLAERYKKIVICADNDVWGDNNTGIIEARKASVLISCEVIFPIFDKDDIPAGNHPTDFNDFHRIYGLEKLKDYLQLVIPEPEAELEAESEATGGNEIDIIGDVRNITEPARTGIIESPPVYFTNYQGRKLPTIDNLRLLLKYQGVKVKYNVIKKIMNFEIPSYDFDISLDQATFGQSIIKSMCLEEGWTHGELMHDLKTIANENQYNPVAEWILSKKWDGVSRLELFYETVKVKKHQENKKTIMKRWMLSAIAGAFELNGVNARGVMVFQGKQYIGKTMWLRSLAPKEYKFILEGHVLDVSGKTGGSKDSVLTALSFWITELGEIDATLKSNQAGELKSFIPKNEDNIRPPYGRGDVITPRRTVFFGSVNPEEFLVDETGNTRFWVIQVEELNYNHELDMQQVWAEFYELYRAGEKWIMLENEMQIINAVNHEYTQVSIYEEHLINMFDFENWDKNQWATATQICKFLDFKHIGRAERDGVAKAMRKLNHNRWKRENSVIVFAVPKRK
jgi:putative DNA primase/helicase